MIDLEFYKAEVEKRKKAIKLINEKFGTNIELNWIVPMPEKVITESGDDSDD